MCSWLQNYSCKRFKSSNQTLLDGTVPPPYPCLSLTVHVSVVTSRVCQECRVSRNRTLNPALILTLTVGLSDRSNLRSRFGPCWVLVDDWGGGGVAAAVHAIPQGPVPLQSHQSPCCSLGSARSMVYASVLQGRVITGSAAALKI